MRVALEPVVPCKNSEFNNHLVLITRFRTAELPKMIRGLELLTQADPSVESFQQSTGEYVIMTAGELHLEVRFDVRTHLPIL